MTAYLENALRQARGVASNLRLRPRARFESFVPELEVAEPPTSLPPPVIAAAQLGMSQSSAPVQSESERRATDNQAVDRHLEPHRESVRDAHHVTSELHVQHVEYSRSSHVSEETIRHIAAIQRAAAITEPPTERTSTTSVAQTLAPSGPTLKQHHEQTTQTVPPVAPTIQRERTPAPALVQAAERVREFHERRTLQAESAAEVTVVIGRLEVQVVRDRPDERADKKVRRGATDNSVQRAAPTLNDYLSNRSGKSP